MLKKALLFVLLLVSFGCATYSENFVKEGELSLRGGRYQDDSWRDTLRFTRVSWYQELSLLFDYLYVEIDEESPFYAWFSEAEIDSINKCDQFYVTLTYALEPLKISKADFNRQLEAQGVRQLSLPVFRQYFYTHPDMERLSLRQYDISGACLSSKGSFEVDFPGYRKVVIQ